MFRLFIARNYNIRLKQDSIVLFHDSSNHNCIKFINLVHQDEHIFKLIRMFRLFIARNYNIRLKQDSIVLFHESSIVVMYNHLDDSGISYLYRSLYKKLKVTLFLLIQFRSN